LPVKRRHSDDAGNVGPSAPHPATHRRERYV